MDLKSVDLPVDDLATISSLNRRDVHLWTSSKIRKLEGQLASIKAVHNAAALISRLPDELLLEIFHMVCHPHLLPDPDPYLEWMSMLCVCSRWRSLGLATPTLWTKIYIDSNSPDLLEFACQNAVPLRLEISIYACRTIYDVPRFSGILRCHADRIRSLCLANLPIYKSLRGCSFSNLEYLELEDWYAAMYTHSDSDSDSDSDSMLGFESDTSNMVVFSPTSSEFPSLRQLVLSSVIIPEPFADIYGSLRYLQLWAWSCHIRTFADLYELLAECPILEELDIHALPHRTGSHSSQLKEVTLPQLHKLSLESDADYISSFLDHIIIPKKTQIALTLKHADWRDGGNPIFSALPLDMPLSMLSEELKVDIEIGEREVYVDVVPEAHDSARLRVRVQRFDVRVSKGAQPDLEAIIADIVAVFHGATVTQLAIRTVREFSREHWTSLLSVFTATTVVTISVKNGSASEHVFQALDISANQSDSTPARSSSMGSAQSSNVVLCSTLRQLRVEVTGEDEQITDEAAKAMFAMVRSRGARGTALEKLEVTPLEREFRLGEGDIKWVEECCASETCPI